jgi:hypothetical protein
MECAERRISGIGVHKVVETIDQTRNFIGPADHFIGRCRRSFSSSGVHAALSPASSSRDSQEFERVIDISQSGHFPLWG